jgi:hypothetical protein
MAGDCPLKIRRGVWLAATEHVNPGAISRSRQHRWTGKNAMANKLDHLRILVSRNCVIVLLPQGNLRGLFPKRPRRVASHRNSQLKKAC